MNTSLQLFENLPQHIYVFAVILAVLTIAFLLFFVIPSFVVSWRITSATRRLRVLQGKGPGELGQVFRKGVLAHLWREYSHTLHEQAVGPPLIKPGSDPTQTKPGSDPNKTGSDPEDAAAADRAAGAEKRWRSTVPAEAIFRPEVVVDTPLRSEFFRHLPGLFTGVGIIGTFFGLLMGLRAFQVSENPVVVRDSLNNLLHGVWEAFLVSAVAIALAMIVTLIERLVIARLYAKVEKLVQVLDGMFEAGAGEEYLARLVKASEASAAGNAALKDALAAELRKTLVELNEKNVAATHALGERIALSIETGLRAPLVEVAGGLKGLQTEQWGAVQAMLSEVLSGHTRQLQGMFGDQVEGINGLQQQTIDALHTAVTRLEQMAAGVEAAGTRGASGMAERLEAALAAADNRQRAMNESMAEFVEQIRLVVARSQGETQGRLQGTLDDLSARMGSVIEALSNQVTSATETSRRHHDALAGQTTRMVGEVGGQVGAIVDGVNRAVGEMKAAVEAMSRTTTDALGKLDSGASTVSSAAADFARAGQSVSGALEKADAIADRLSHAADSVAGVSTGLTSVVTDYQSARDSIADLVRSLQVTVEQARRETLMSDDVLGRIDSAASKLADAQREADTYLGRVSDVLGVAHRAFSEGMVQTVGEANREFHTQLSESVRLLRMGIQELQATLESMNTR
jgi:hypothetical protein